MQNSKRTIIGIFGIIIVMIIVAIVLISQGENTDRLANLYHKLLDSKKYTFEIEEVDSEYNYKMTVAQNGQDININTKSGDDESSTLILNGKVYVIMHKQQEYYAVNSNDVDGDIIVSGLKETSEKKYSSGREEIQGKMYYYEEYKDVLNFLMLLHETEDSEVTTRFYFDKDNIVFIKNIVKDEDENQEEILKINVKFDVDNNLFEIPSDYAEL